MNMPVMLMYIAYCVSCCKHHKGTRLKNTFHTAIKLSVDWADTD